MTSASSQSASIRRRFVVLRGLRWLPTGLLIPVLVLLILERGFSLGQLGIVVAFQGLMVLIQELPTGGLADAIGRRRVLLVAAGFELAAVALLVVADTLPLLAVVFALQGVYRALESGPLDSWYVDSARAIDPDADIEGGLASAGAVLGVAVGVGSLASGAFVALDPIAAVDPLVVPVIAALVLRLVDVAAVAVLMTETDRTEQREVSAVPWRRCPQ